MSRNKHSRSPSRRRVKPTVLIGDPGRPQANKVIEPITPDLTQLVDNDLLTTREMVTLLLRAGCPIADIFGIDHCYEHYRFKHIRPDLGTPTSVNPAFDVVYCRNCGEWYRDPDATKLDTLVANYEADLHALQLRQLRTQSGGSVK